MDIATPRVDDSAITTHKIVRTAGKELETPAKALQVGKLRKAEDVVDTARGVAETFATATNTKLENSRTSGFDRLADNLRLQAERAEDDEIVVPFLKFDDTEDLTLENAKEAARLQSNYGDILSVPLQTELTYEANDGDGLGEDPVETIVENTRTYLNAVEDLEIEKPVMAVFPSISKAVTDELTKMYIDRGLRAFCVDFNRRTATAKAQQDQVITPLMRSLLAEDLHEVSLVYAVNLKNGKPKDDGRRSPEQVYAYTLGFDVVGDVHLPPRLPPEVFEDMDDPSGVRLFDSDTLSFRDVELDDVDEYLPEDSEFTAAEVRRRVKSKGNDRYRLSNLINAELISLFLKLIEDEDKEDELFELLAASPEAIEEDLDEIADIVARVIGSDN
ncbi:hypothetical protein [Haloferax volcanii]|uniref:hypothetical protein n=1 Tax=Haloferax volcanii TaxID=2246 RepID=UPI00385210E4